MESLKISCDIVIPVYNALDDLKECIGSVLKNTDSRHRIIIINDCSTDERVNEYLDQLKKQFEQIVVFQNDKNLGFVATVNRGMRFSNRDVVLLNSDTIVTKNWLEKLIEAAYSDEAIGTVTPFTNNGTICSIPNFCENNSIPEGYTIDSFAEFIEKVSLKRFPELPTAVGFCMYIKRKVIEEIGYFDAESFGKGYGEENDFCCKVLEHGYTNNLADHVFIYHKGSVSFQGEKEKLIKRNREILVSKYPYYDSLVQNFMKNNPLKPLHDNIKFRMQSYKYGHILKGNVLHLIHNFFDEPLNHPVGGTEFHLKDLVENMNSYNHFILVSNSHELVLKHFQQGHLVAKYRFPLDNPIKLHHFHHKEYSQILEKIIENFNIGLLHIQHLKQHPFDAVRIAKNFNIKVLFSLHDFYLFCPRTNLLDINIQYCKDLRSESKCQNCLYQTYGFHTPFINKWKSKVSELIQMVDLFITPSESTKKLFVDEFEQIRNKIIKIEHGMDRNKQMNESKALKTYPKDKLKVGFLGGIAPNKGSDLIYKLITNIPKEKIEWHIIGGIGDRKLSLLEQKNLIKHGEYRREDLDGHLAKINLDLICLLSPWPETYSYTLSEAWRNHIPVLVTPMGALKERVEKVGGGWIAEQNSYQSVQEKLLEICKAGQEEWDNVFQNIQNYQFKSKEEMVLQYEELYDKYYVNNEKSNNIDNTLILSALKYYMDDYNYPDSYVKSLENEIMLIKSSIGWKILERLRRKHGWLLFLGKHMIYFILKLKRLKLNR